MNNDEIILKISSEEALNIRKNSLANEILLIGGKDTVSLSDNLFKLENYYQIITKYI